MLNFRGETMIVEYSKLTNDTVFKMSFLKFRKGKRHMLYNDENSGFSFDIETSTKIQRTKDKNGKVTDLYAKSYMYVATFGIGNIAVSCKTWDEVKRCIDRIKKVNHLSEEKRCICWIANLPFEFQFMRKRFNFTDIIAKTQRQVLYALMSDCIELRDALAITGSNLEHLANNYCTIKKLVGDLDYTKERNKDTPRTRQENAYIENDVLILTQFHTYYCNKFIVNGFMPLTKTAIVRNDIKNSAKSLGFFKYKQLLERIKECQPNEYLYKMMVNWLFRGGYVHANYKYADMVLLSILFADIKSSYPYQMLTKYYPVTPFVEGDVKKFKEYLKRYCCIIDVEFTNIKAKTTISIESESKCISSECVRLDNGRILQAKKIHVLLTELDFETYQNYYTWESYKVNAVLISERGKLPKYLTKTIIKYFEIKENTPKESVDYMLNKGNLNSCYGMLVTRLIDSDFIFSNGEVIQDEPKTYDEQIQYKILLPQWGVWCTAHARKQLLDLSLQLDMLVYNDTDSAECKFNIHNLSIIKKTNDRIITENKKIFKQPFLWKIGTFEIEDVADKFKTLGAKRYIYTIDTKDYVTISGLPKNALQKYCETYKKDIYDVFDNDMLLDIGVSLKNTAIYNDEPSSDVIDGQLMTELSSVAIVPIAFKLKVKELYILLIDNYRKEIEKYEDRIY